MKLHIKRLITAIIFLFPMLLSAQVFDQDSVFFLEKKTQELGRTIMGKNKNYTKGFGARISTGYMSSPYFNNFYHSYSAVVPLNLEFGYKFYFLELGYRYSRAGIPLGVDDRWVFGPVTSTLTTFYNLPINVGLTTHSGMLTLHFPIKALPVFFNFGVGRSVFENSNRNIALYYNSDGTRDYVYSPGLSPVTAKVKTRTKTFGLGFEKGMLFGGVEWMLLKGINNETSAGLRERFQYMHLGIQMYTSAKKKRTKEITPLKNHVQIGLSKIALMAPWRQSGTGSGWAADIAFPVTSRIQITASAQFSHKYHGREKFVPDSPTDTSFYFQLGNTAGYLKRHILYGGYQLNPGHLFKTCLYAGGGYYLQSQPKDAPKLGDGIYPYLPQTNSAGFVAGAGFEYKYVHSQVLLHKPFNGYPVVMEWNLGGRFLF